MYTPSFEKFITKKSAERTGLFLTPTNVSDLISKISIADTDKPLNILDPAVGTGRLLMSAYKHAPKSRLFGVDIDMNLIRIAMTNMAIHNIQGYLLNANSLLHEIDISKENGRYNWQYANRWNTCIENLKSIKKQG